MSLRELLKYTSARDTFPIEVDEIKKWMLNKGIHDEINFIPDPAMDVKVLRGSLVQYEYCPAPYEDNVRVADISYATDQSLCWQRLVCCKELVHLLDRPETHTATKEQIEALTLHLSMGLEASIKHNEALTDHAGVFISLCVLAPLDAVNALRRPYEAGELNDYDIALFFRIPEFYVSSIFHPAYVIVYNNCFGNVVPMPASSTGTGS